MEMKDDTGLLVGIGVRALEAGHAVRYWAADRHPGGRGLIEKVLEWQPHMDWADLVVLSGNCDYPPGLDAYFGKGYPIFGTNPKAAELELDRGLGQKVLREYGIQTIPYKVVRSVEEAIRLVCKTGQGYAMKPWGGDADKAMTCLCKTPDDAIFTLKRWEAKGLFKGELMMQELVEGVEVGISGFFGPGGWSRALEESFEHKKFLNDDLGQNTGEMGTVIRHVRRSKLFDMILEPLTDYLHVCNFVGDCNVNCIVTPKGVPLPLEFTVRLGWPDYNIRQEVIKGDPLEWMLDLLNGADSLEVSQEIVCGVLVAHGDFPWEADPPQEWAGYPLHGITPEIAPHVHYQQAMRGPTPLLVGSKVRDVEMDLTAGARPLVVTGCGRTVVAARGAAYAVLGGISCPSNIMYRTDIGRRLEADLPALQKHGFAEGMRYA